MSKLFFGALVGLLAVCVPAAASSIVNGDFSDGLTGWSHGGAVDVQGGQAVLGEDPPMIRTWLERSFVVPVDARRLSFRYEASRVADGTSGSPLPDAFVAYLLDPTSYVPLLAMPGDLGFFRVDGDGLALFDPALVTLVGDYVALDLRSVASGTDALIAFDLLGANDGLDTEVRLDNVAVFAGDLIPEPLTAGAFFLGISGVIGYLRRRGSES
jgi:hypothetical protein